MGWSDLGCYGSEIPTPHIDSLAKQGMLATRLYTCARCSPSRAALLTGCEPHRVGVGLLDDDKGKPGYRGRLTPDIPTLAELLREAGYRTYLSGKWHLGKVPGAYPWNRGFDHSRGLLGGAADYYQPMPDRPFGEDGRLLKPSDLPGDFYMTDDITSTALRYLDSAAQTDAPFFLYVAYTAPHTPLQAPKKAIKRMRQLYEGKTPMAVANARLARQKKLGLVPTRAALSMRNALNAAAAGKKSPTEYQTNCMATYAAQIAVMDDGVGKILAKLDALKLSDNTIVLFLSDNGATAETPQNNPRYKSTLPVGPLGERGCRDGYGAAWAAVSNTPYRQYKIETFDGGLSAPFLVRFPGHAKPGSRFHQAFRLQDVAPTVLEWAGLEVPKHMDGRALGSLWKSPAKISPAQTWSQPPAMAARLPLFWEHQGNRAVLTPQFKLVAPKGGRWQVYALDDRAEQRDLAPSRQNQVRELNRQYHDWARKNQVE